MFPYIVFYGPGLVIGCLASVALAPLYAISLFSWQRSRLPGGGWHTNSPSYIAASAGSPVAGQAVSNATGMITVSPDGTTIAWYGTDGAIHYFSNIDDVYYSYGSFAAGIYPALNSLQFNANSDLYWIRPDMPSVRRMVYQLAFCENLALTNYP